MSSQAAVSPKQTSCAPVQGIRSEDRSSHLIVLPARLKPTLLRNRRTAFALLVLLSPTIAFCQATPTEPVPQESQPAQMQSPTPNPAPPQKSLPEAPISIIDPNE